MLSVGVDEGYFFWWCGGGEKMLFLGSAVPKTGSQDLHNIAVGGPASLVAALELKGAGGDADDIAVEVDHGAVGEGVDIYRAVAKLGFPFALVGFEVDGAFRAGAGGQEHCKKTG